MAKVNKRTVLICVGVFLLGLIFMFPLQNLKGLIFQKVFEQSGVLIVAEEIYPVFLGWPGVGLKNANVTLPVGEGSDIGLSSKTVTLRLRLMSSLVPGVSLALDELKGGGDLFIRFGQKGPLLNLGLDSKELNLSQIRIPGLGSSIEGVLKSDIDLKYNDQVFSETKGSLRLKGTQIKLPAILVNNPMLGPPFQIPELVAGDLDVKVSIKDGNMAIQSFSLGNKNTDVSGSILGEAKLGTSPSETQINLTLKISFSPKILENQEYKTFLDFLGAYRTGTAGEYAMNWTASINEILNLTKALPSPLRQ